MTSRFMKTGMFVLSTGTSALVGAGARLHRNETGAEEGMNKLLIFALVALPLLALLYAFGGEIIDLATESFDRSTNSGQALDPGR